MPPGAVEERRLALGSVAVATNSWPPARGKASIPPKRPRRVPSDRARKRMSPREPPTAKSSPDDRLIELATVGGRRKGCQRMRLVPSRRPHIGRGFVAGMLGGFP